MTRGKLCKSHSDTRPKQKKSEKKHANRTNTFRQIQIYDMREYIIQKLNSDED